MSTPSRLELFRQFLPHSPLAVHLGIALEAIEPDRCVLAMPFKPELVTVGDVVHGGAIASLLDTALTGAAWATEEPSESPGGSTVSINVDYVSAARACDLTATASVVRRGRRLCFLRGEATDPAGKVVAAAQATYMLA